MARSRIEPTQALEVPFHQGPRIRCPILTHHMVRGAQESKIRLRNMSNSEPAGSWRPESIPPLCRASRKHTLLSDAVDLFPRNAHSGVDSATSDRRKPGAPYALLAAGCSHVHP